MTHLLLAANNGTNLDPIYSKALFWILAILSVGAAITMIFMRQAVHCALMLAVVMLSLAVLYAMQGAPFLAFVQIIVYTGAVLMLFLFVVMLIGVTSSDSLVETIRGQRLWRCRASTSAPTPRSARWCSRTGSAPSPSRPSGSCPAAGWPAGTWRPSRRRGCTPCTTPSTCRRCCLMEAPPHVPYRRR